jgi:MFS family permease
MQFEQIKARLLERPMTSYQVLAVAIGVLVNMMDGYDLLAIAFAAPGLQRAWMLTDAQLGALLSAGLLGMAFGAFGLSWVSDVVGRRVGTMINLGVMTTGMASAALAPSYEVLFAARLLTGFGIGAMTASIGSLVYELASKQRREVSLGCVTAAFPIGTIIGGQVSIWLLDVGWQAVFAFGAVLSAALIPLVYFALPESLDFLVGRQPRNALERVNRELERLDFEPMQTLPRKHSAALESSVPLRDVILPPVLLSTILACLGYFGFMISQYFILNWMPSLLVDIGYADESAISLSLVMNYGAILGCAVMGFMTAKWGVRPMTVAMLLIMSASIAAFGRLPIDAVQLIRTSSFFIGFASFATAVGIFSIMASGFPSHVRSTGIGFSFTAGRLGAAAGAYLGGLFLSLGFERPQLCLVLAVPGVIAAGVVSLLAKRNVGSALRASQPVAQ